MPKMRIVKVDFGQQANAEMWQYVTDSTKYWTQRTRRFREEKLKEYARLYKGTPKSESKDFPWPGASNTVVQIIATHCDQLLSRVMATYMTEPIWPAKIFGDIDQGQGEDQREAIEKFMGAMALEPEELDFYRVEEAWASGVIRNGTGVIKFPWLYAVEQELSIGDEMFSSDSSAIEAQFQDVIKFDGPRPENLPLNQFLINTDCQDIDSAKFKCHIMPMGKMDIEARVAMGLWSREKVDKILASPDRSSAMILQQYMENQQGLDLGQDSGKHRFNDEYDIHECWIKYNHNGKTYRICATHHPLSNTNLLAFFNFYPKNLDIFEDAKLAYDDDQYYGYGFAEMLKAYQEEISTLHNQRIDAKTLGNTTAFRIDKDSKLHSILTFYPGVLVPANKDEIDRLDTANPQADSLDGENLSLALAKERSGIDPAIGGTGGGIVNQKRGIYSSQGTFAVLQQQNNRTGLRMSDMRSAHARAGRKFTEMYAAFGIGTKLSKYGDNSLVLGKAFENIKSGRLGISIRPATASLNKELEKQNDIMLAQTLERLYASDAQILQSLGTQGMPEDLKAYYIDVLKAKNALMSTIVKNFGHDDAARLIPVPSVIKEGRGTNGQAKSEGGGNSRSFAGVGGTGQSAQPVQQQGESFGTLPVGSGESANQLPS